MARSARRKPDAGVVPVGFLDDDRTLAGGHVAQPPPARVRDDVRELLAMATGGREDELRTALLDYVGGVGEPQPADLLGAAWSALRAIPMEIGDRTQPASIVG